ncbi:hypothetical protein ERX46_09550 [Brumimicrobium glaciale]|uniref:DUF7281 domain-containing protein n=1 Tax=Brumimicrobium glaciale TaxID=200475 RepID=A0A4Q4KLM2_9FLAO|nr:hypothetical protein [Brumimicrobium glaciale]RYM34192.1 hypothetical protein ERX46_09550 [Brumimicrobium glaciale]
MKLTLKIAKVLVQLIDGEAIPASSAKSKLIDDLVSENIIFRKGKQRKTLELLNEEALHIYLANQLQINDLKKYISAVENTESSRTDFVKITTDSKHSKERAFKGFLINCYHPIVGKLNGQEFIVNPSPGSFVFIYDFETFKIPKNVTVVGVENAKNFSQIEEQKQLFKDINPLFVSRYPQNQNKDFIQWMKSIPNDYLHFGDFDFAGIGIYLNEYKKKIIGKSSFFIPKNIDIILSKYGNRKRYDIQKMNFNQEDIKDEKLLGLVYLIALEKKGLDQEFFIGK